MPSADVKFEIGHVLFIDIVGYSKLLINEQSDQLDLLRNIVRKTEQFQIADREGKLLRLPTGDGGALVFRNNPEAPLLCAMEISEALIEHPNLKLRMGIHSGPVNEVADLNNQANIAGAGVNIAQRVMDCGDAGHILLSKRVADDLSPYPKWNPFLHDLGECRVKHGAKVGLVNFFSENAGNPAVPSKCQTAGDTAVPISTGGQRRRTNRARVGIGLALLLVAAGAAGVVSLWHRTSAKTPTNEPASNAPPSKSIAVLPFENASNDSNAEYLSEGISEALINSLTELQQLRVIARSTAFHYKGKDIDPQKLGRELHVGAVLTGRVRQMQDSLNVQVDLIDTATGAQLWGADYDRRMSDVIAVKQAIAREIIEKLKLKLSGDEQHRLVRHDTMNAEAYQSYLRGRYFWNKRTPDGLNHALEQFQQAITRDPNFALGYVGLADSYLLLQQYVGVPSSEAMPKARAAVDRALQMDDSLAEAHASSGLVYQFAWHWAEAAQAFRQAVSLNDNYATAHHWFGTYFLMKLELGDALKEIKRAQELDPLSPIINANLAIIFLLKNDTNAAVQQCQNIVALDPNHISGHDWLGWAYFEQGRLGEATAEREKAAELSQRSGPQLSGVGYLYAVTGRRSEALAILDELEQKYASGKAVGQHLAAIYDGLGDADQAFAWLEKDFEQHSAELQFITWRVQFKHLRRDPRYANLMRRMGLNP